MSSTADAGAADAGGLAAGEAAAAVADDHRRPAPARPRTPARLNLPQAPALYALLESTGCGAAQVHAACLAAVKARLLSLVADPNADKEKLRNLARKALAYVDVPELREITLALVAAHREAVGDETLERLVRDQKLLSDAPVAAKQAIWLRNPTLLPEYLGPLLDAYASDEELHAASLEMVWQVEGDAGAQPGTWSPGGAAAAEGVTTVGITGRDIVSLTKMRRSYPIVRQIIKAFGETEELYGQIMPLCRLGFRNALEASGKRVYPEMIGTLSSDLIMTLHQNHFEHLSGHTGEEMHTLIWNMDACKGGGGLLDISRIHELNAKCFDHLEPDSPTYIDAAIVVLDPYTQNMFASTILHCLEELAPHILNGLDGLRQDQEKLLATVEWSTNLAELGRRAKNMMEVRARKMPHIFDSSFRKFYWVGMARMIQQDLERAKKTPEKRSGAPAPAAGEEPLGKEHYGLMNEHDIPLRVYVHYVLSRVAAADAPGVRLGLRPLLAPDGPLPSFRNLSAAAWQSLVSVLLRPAPLRRLLSAEDPTFRRACVDDGLLVAASSDDFANLQLARLALEVLEGAERLTPENAERLDEVDAAREVEKVRHTAADAARGWAESAAQHEARRTGSRSVHDAAIRKLLAAYLRRAAANAVPAAFSAASPASRRHAAMYNYQRDVAAYLFGEWQPRQQVPPVPASTHKRGRPDDWAAGGEDDRRSAKSADAGGSKGGGGGGGKDDGDELMWLD